MSSAAMTRTTQVLTIPRRKMTPEAYFHPAILAGVTAKVMQGIQ
jgi:hypothetical protein